jgi:malonyl-CoA/methylmalonyl-CoA synthetase
MVERARTFAGRVALDAPDGEWTYDTLLNTSAAVSARLRDGIDDLAEKRVAYLIEPGGGHVASLWGIWRAGGIAVPLAVSHPRAELEHVLTDSGASTIIADAVHRPDIEELARTHGLRIIDAPAAPAIAPGPHDDRLAIDEARRSLIVYTSGTTGKPKGAVHTHGSIRAQIEMLVEAWGWSAADRTLLVLPLHHVHGLVNVVCCALWCGARCDVLPRFDADATMSRMESGSLTVFMAVPTVYSRLISLHDEAPPDRRARMSDGCRRMRLMVSGSAALPVPTLERWREISGHVLLERYGMTELGMILSNPLDGERRPGHVGTPLPGVEVRLIGDDGSVVPSGAQGEIQVRSPGLFLEYWRRPQETHDAFRNGWFRTGDIARFDNGVYRILGRRSVDILKTGGYKVSALEIEDVLRSHPAIADCAVVGLPDDDLGERIAAAVIVRAGQNVEPDSLRAWARERLAPYKVPALVRTVDDLPRNAMGKVTKPAVRDMLNNTGGTASRKVAAR